MATKLLKWEKDLPQDFYCTKTHTWILIDGKVRMSAKKSHMNHSTIWGEFAWDVKERGYYNDKYGLISVHHNVDSSVVDKLAKKFPRAMYIRKSWS